MNGKEFPKGIYIKKPHEKAPDFVLGKLSIKVADAISYLKTKQGEWLNLDMKQSKDGKWYLEVDNWIPNQSNQQSNNDDQW